MMKSSMLEEAEVAQTERIGLGDLVIIFGIGALTFGLSTLWQFPGLYPSVWESAAVAAGVRPAADVVPGYWTTIATIIYKTVGIAHAPAVLHLIGQICLAGLAIGVYAVLREWLGFAMRMRPQLSTRRTIVQQLAAAVGALAFVLSDPVWTLGQCFSEAMVQTAITLASLEFFFVFLRKGTIKYAYLCALCLGFLAAETPMGIILAGLFIGINIFILKFMPSLESPFFRPEVMEVGKWHMTFLYLAAIICGVVLNCWTFVEHSGLEAIGASVGDVPLHYLLDYWRNLVVAGSLHSWILWVGVCILPFVVTTIKFPESADEEQFLSYASGIIYFSTGLVVLAQFASLPALWFWTYFPMNSQYMLGIGLFCCAATLAQAVTILGVDSFCRDHGRLAQQAFGEIPMQGEDEDDEDEDERLLRRAKRRGNGEPVESLSTVFLRRLGLIVIPLAVVSVMIPGRQKQGLRQMLSVLHDGIAEIVREAGDAKYLITDGNLDTAIELEAARVGSPLRCYSLMGGGPLAVYLRTRNLVDKEDLFSFRLDTGMGLRAWLRDKPERLAECAALMGFDLWKRDGKPLPPMGGLLSRPTGFKDEAEQQRGLEAAEVLCHRVMEIAKKPGTLKSCTDVEVKRLFHSLQWRLSRMCFYRAEAYDHLGKTDESIRNVTLSKELDEVNGLYQELVANMERRNQSLMQKLTPREGLQLALVRADFTMGKLYADTILNADPDNPDANFAVGMFYLKERQLSRAERYLTRCLIRKPNEPAVYNNLAMIQIELKKFDAARVNVEKALALIPDSAAVIETKKSLEAAIEAAKGK